MYLAAFLSLWVQIEGLIGPRGILPADRFLDNVAARFGADRFFAVPTLCWWTGAGSVALHGLCAAGTAASLALLFGLASGPAALAAWALYLSLVGVGRPFLSFQWDSLLLEAGFASLALAPWRLGFERGAHGEPSGAALFLLRFLVFKLMFLSGWAKLASGDPTWRDLSALGYHYLTTCLPTWTGWIAYKLPDAIHRASTAGALAIELALPLLVFGGPGPRAFACAGFAMLQVAIASTGNYGFFNLLSLALCVPLLDDRRIAWLLPKRVLDLIDRAAGTLSRPAAGAGAESTRRRYRPRAATLFAAGLLMLSASPVWITLFGAGSLPGPLRTGLHAAARLEIANGYGLFAVMTTSRPEIIIEGSNDGRDWRAYEFRFKPGDPLRRPGFVQPHLPRLDWQMWFAALSDATRQSWFPHFMRRLQEGSPPVLGLLAHDPFAGAPPRLLRATLYDYRFSRFADWRATGRWWERERLRPYFGPLERR